MSAEEPITICESDLGAEEEEPAQKIEEPTSETVEGDGEENPTEEKAKEEENENETEKVKEGEGAEESQVEQQNADDFGDAVSEPSVNAEKEEEKNEQEPASVEE